MNNKPQYWTSICRYINSKKIIEELSELLGATSNELYNILDAFEQLKNLHTLHSFLIKIGNHARNNGSNKFDKGGVADLFCRSISIQLNKMEFDDIRQCFDNYVN